MGDKGDPGELPPRPARTFFNPLIAEAAALAKERQLLSAAQDGPSTAKQPSQHQGEHDDGGADVVKKGKSRWMDDDEDEDDHLKNSPQAAAAGAKRRRSPIIWQDQSKVPRTQENGTTGPAAPSSRPMTMAERAQAEVEKFRRRQAELAAEEEEEAAAANEGERDTSRYIAHSPDISSPEEEMHIRREGNSAHGLIEEEEQKETKNKSGGGGGGLDDLDDLEGSPDEKTLSPQQRYQEKQLERTKKEEEGDEQGKKHDDAVDEDKTEEDLLEGPIQGPKVQYGSRYMTENESAAFGNQYHEKNLTYNPDFPQMEEDQRDKFLPDGSLHVRIFNPDRNLKRQASMLNECRSVENYEKLNRISEGTYGVVYRARDRETNQICALKKVKLEKERDGFPLTSVREINVLLSLTHPSIVNVSEVVVGYSLDSVFMVMEYADHDLKGVMEKRMQQAFTISEIKCLMHQLLSGVAYLHANWVIHRDLKTSNILYTNKGQLKICDFGLARQYGEPLKPYTQLVVTLWYRSPELLLGATTYSTGVDVWSCGCIMAELLKKDPLFKGASEIAQLDRIFQVLGYPTSETWPGVEKLSNYKKFVPTSMRGSGGSTLRKIFPPPGPIFDGRPTLSETGFDLLKGLLELCPEKRLSAQEALDHPWFREHPLPKDPAMMPTFPGTNESIHGHRN